MMLRSDAMVRMMIRVGLVGVLMMGAMTFPAHAQTSAPGNKPAPAEKFNAQNFEDQAKELMQEMQKPDFDIQQFGQKMRDLMQKFQEQTKDMDPAEVDKIRQQMMEHLQPLIQKSMPTIMQRMQQGMMDNLKKQMECSDEEFAAIRPSLQKVMDNMRALGIGMGRGGRGGGFGGPPRGNNGTPSEIQQATEDLHNALEDTNAAPALIKAKLDALRLAKEKAMQELAQSRNNLKSLLTIRQESVLVSNGILE
jgi:hypothetical protein